MIKYKVKNQTEKKRGNQSMAKKQAEAVINQRPFIMLYQDFLESNVLENCHQKIVYICLKFFANSQGECFPSLKQLARLAKISTNKVKCTINELVQMGLVKKEHRTRLDGGTDSNRYMIQDSIETWGGQQRPDGKRTFIKVYKDFLENDQLDNCYQKLVYIYLGKFANSDQKCFPSIRTLAEVSGICISKVKSTINELVQKGMISKENRKRQDGGKNSNLYTLLYNLEKKLNIWNSKNTDSKKADGDIDNHVSVEKEKGLDSLPTKVKNQAPKPIHINDYTTPNPRNCQVVERYSLEFIREHFGYETVVAETDAFEEDVDAVMHVLYDMLNTTKPTIRVNGEDKPSRIVIDRLTKMHYWAVEYAINQFIKQDKQRIRNPKAYMQTILYNAATGDYDLDLKNQMAYCEARWYESRKGIG